MRGLIERNYTRAEKILKQNLDKLHAMAEALLKYETIGTDQIEDVMANREVREPANWQSARDAAAQKEKDKSQGEQQSLKLHDDRGAAPVDGTSTS